MSTIKGQNLRIFVPGTTANSFECVAEATSCQITINGDTEGVSTKDDELFDKQQTTSRSWSVQVDTFDAATATIKKYITIIKNTTPLLLKWDQTAGAQNRVAQDAAFARKGSAYLTDLTLTANNRQTASLSLQFTGTGAIEPITTT